MRGMERSYESFLWTGSGKCLFLVSSYLCVYISVLHQPMVCHGWGGWRDRSRVFCRQARGNVSSLWVASLYLCVCSTSTNGSPWTRGMERSFESFLWTGSGKCLFLVSSYLCVYISVLHQPMVCHGWGGWRDRSRVFCRQARGNVSSLWVASLYLCVCSTSTNGSPWTRGMERSFESFL